MSEDRWLGETIRRIETDVKEIKDDVRVLREQRAENHGKAVILAAVVSVLISALAIIFRIG